MSSSLWISPTEQLEAVNLELLYQQILEGLQNNRISEALTLLEEFYARNRHNESYDKSCPIERTSESAARNADTILDLQKHVVNSLQDYLESVAYTWDMIQKVSSDHQSARTGKIQMDRPTAGNVDVKRILECIAHLYKHIAMITRSSTRALTSIVDHNDHDIHIQQNMAECYLDWAIAAKRAGMMRDCVEAHTLRMNESSDLKCVDAVRLLGLLDTADSSELRVEEFNTRGLFESKLVCKNFQNCDENAFDTKGVERSKSTYLAHQPTEKAIELGNVVSNIFREAKYCISSCNKVLSDILSLHGIDGMLHEREQLDEAKLQNFSSSGRIYSANSFFNHRHEALHLYKDLQCDNALKALIFLFLFGVSLERKDVLRALGDVESVDILFQAGILRTNPVDKAYVVGEVQIFPLNLDTFEPIKASTLIETDCLLFMTDWSMESLRLPRDAIMAIGYDSLELVALSSGSEAFTPKRGDPVISRVLDLCCGCGIQGIYATKKSITWRSSQIRCELVSMDINKRACHFVTANACLNGIIGCGPSYTKSTKSIYAIEANLFEPIYSDLKEESLSSPIIGKFDRVLCNPPFVAVPFAQIVNMAPALYSAGGGSDGMELLRLILSDCFNILHDGIDASLLMVTELPNVEDSCKLLQKILGNDQAFNIRVAYVKDDVELVEDYATEREVEAGIHIEGRDWNHTTMVKNRALVLISISRARETSSRHLFCYGGREDANTIILPDIADEEDQFLTARGIKFTRENLL